MKTRIISGAIGLVLLLVIVWSGQAALGIGIFLLSLIAVHEFYSSVSSAGYKPVTVIGFLLCLPLFFLSFKSSAARLNQFFSSPDLLNYIFFVLFALIAVLLSLIVFQYGKRNLNDIALTIFGILYVPFLFSFIILTRSLENGFTYVWLIFIGAWSTDTFAYFTGKSFGRNKLIPNVSPNKTVEGSIGGVTGCILAMIIYWLAMGNKMPGMALYHFIILGILCGILSQIGDLAASAIKRYVKIKDYGKIMPGHGGILDRFDSILFIAPVIYFYIVLVVI